MNISIDPQRLAEWVEAHRASDDVIDEFAELMGWNGQECRTECGDCYRCGIAQVTCWIGAVLTNPYVLDIARAAAKAKRGER